MFLGILPSCAARERMDERTMFVDEFQYAASKDGNWLIVGKFTESAECSCGANYK